MADNGNLPKDILTAAQHRAIATLLSQRDIKSAAKAAKVGERTLHRWLKQHPDFVLALREAEADTIEHLTRQLVRLGGDATQTIEDTMKDNDASAGVKLRAADIVLTNLLKLRELANLEARVTAMEAALQKRGNDEPKNTL